MQISVQYVAALILTFTFIVIAAISVIQATARTSTLPLCWRCGANKVRRSAKHCVTDILVKFLFLVPYRCRGCRSRYYGLRSERLAHHPPT
jgi:hypothetical protein